MSVLCFCFIKELFYFKLLYHPLCLRCDNLFDWDIIIINNVSFSFNTSLAVLHIIIKKSLLDC